jgi:hypothetical protein
MPTRRELGFRYFFNSLPGMEVFWGKEGDCKMQGVANAAFQNCNFTL